FKQSARKTGKGTGLFESSEANMRICPPSRSGCLFLFSPHNLEIGTTSSCGVYFWLILGSALAKTGNAFQLHGRYAQ
ncbi:MAG: hypothetical protein LUC91_10385, partial [Prevotella sp.]|nr:hypothetical protein [Prevotella sp.]